MTPTGSRRNAERRRRRPASSCSTSLVTVPHVGVPREPALAVADEVPRPAWRPAVSSRKRSARSNESGRRPATTRPVASRVASTCETHVTPVPVPRRHEARERLARARCVAPLDARSASPGGALGRVVDQLEEVAEVAIAAVRIVAAVGTFRMLGASGARRPPGDNQHPPMADLVSELLATSLDDLMAEARRLRSGTLVTYSPKVFIPLTTLCRDVCGYCTFARPPRRGERAYLTEDEVLAIARAGAEAGCTEALFTLGDRPEARYRVARDGARGARLRDDARVPRAVRAAACSRRRGCCRT